MLPLVLDLFHIEDMPNVRIDMWSHKLNAWVFLVPDKTGQNPPGTYEITPADVHRMKQLIIEGVDTDMAIYQAMGVRPVA